MTSGAATTLIQMTVYIASALGLLVTTSLLGVRRYLRQRKAKVPLTMTASWLGLGGLLIVVFLALGAFLPRPHSEVPWFGIERAGKSEREASKYAQMSDSAGKGEGRGGNQSKAGDGSASGKGGKPGGGSKGEKGSGGKGDKGKGGGGKKGDQSGGRRERQGKGAGERERGEEGSGERARREPGTASREEDTKDDGSDRDRNSGSQSSSQLGGALEKVAGVVKWIIFAIVAVLVVFGLFFGVLKYLAPFTDWARRWLDGIRAWWASLFGKKVNPDRKAGSEEAKPLAPVRPPPFTAYSNPFADGTAETRDPAELIAYTFEALDAWAWDRGAGREPAETALEFARRLGEAFPDHAEAFAKLATLYTRMAYSTLPLPSTALATLEEVWEQMVHGSGRCLASGGRKPPVDTNCKREAHKRGLMLSLTKSVFRCCVTNRGLTPPARLGLWSWAAAIWAAGRRPARRWFLLPRTMVSRQSPRRTSARRTAPAELFGVAPAGRRSSRGP